MEVLHCIINWRYIIHEDDPLSWMNALEVRIAFPQQIVSQEYSSGEVTKVAEIESEA